MSSASPAPTPAPAPAGTPAAPKAKPKAKPIPARAKAFFSSVSESPKTKMLGLGALGTLGYFLGRKVYDESQGITPENLINSAVRDIVKNREREQLARATAQAQAQSYEDSIQMNLQSVRQNAPDLYMAVAAGRRLPQGAVVLGGAPRQDLLNELGRAMADGQFSR